MFETMIQETHLDFFGHVNNAKYLELFEQARWDVITKNGYGFDQIMNLKKGPVILEAHLKYLKELKHRQKVQISVELLEYTGKVGRLKQQMFNEKNEIAAELVVVFGLFDLQTRRLIEATPEWRRALQA